MGSRVRRRSLAINLARQRASQSEIGDMLRHRCRSSTTIYAKLDIERALRAAFGNAWAFERKMEGMLS